MHPFALRAKAFGYRTGKGDHVMTGFKFNLVDAFNIKLGILAQLSGVFLRNNSQLRPGFARTYFHFEPCIEFIFFGPNGPHLRSAVSFDHILSVPPKVSLLHPGQAVSGVLAEQVDMAHLAAGLALSLAIYMKLGEIPSRFAASSISLIRSTAPSRCCPSTFTMTTGVKSEVSPSGKLQIARTCCSNCEVTQASIV